MSSKANMTTEIQETYTKYKDIFNFAKIKAEVFYKWLDGFVTHEELSKANTFIHGGSNIKKFTKSCLLRNLMICQEAFKHFTPEEWERLIFLTKGKDHRQVTILKQTIKELRENWNNRPRPKRKSTD